MGKNVTSWSSNMLNISTYNPRDSYARFSPQRRWKSNDLNNSYRVEIQTSPHETRSFLHRSIRRTRYSQSSDHYCALAVADKNRCAGIPCTSRSCRAFWNSKQVPVPSRSHMAQQPGSASHLFAGLLLSHRPLLFILLLLLLLRIMM